MNPFKYKFCPTLVVFSEGRSTVLMRASKERRGEEDDLMLVSGQMHHGDATIADCFRRIKNEQLGERCQLRLFLALALNQLQRRRDGQHLILAHYAATYVGGPVTLGDAYSGHFWSPLLPSETSLSGCNDFFEMAQKLDMALRVAGPRDCIDI